MLVMEAERFGGPQVLTARQVPDPVAGPLIAPASPAAPAPRSSPRPPTPICLQFRVL